MRTRTRFSRKPGLVSIAVGATILLLFSCASADDTSTTDQPTGPTCNTQACQDRYVASGITSIIWTIYNANIAGHSQPYDGYQGTATCQSAGLAGYQGMVDPDSTITAINDMVYTLTECRYVAANFDLTLNGGLTQNGTYTPSGPPVSMGFNSASLTYSGTVAQSFDPASVGEAGCRIGITQTASSTSGTICGRPFSY